MANEAIPIEGPYEIHDVTVADGAGIAQYTILELADARTCTANNGSGDVFGGIAMSEKVANDGQTELGAAFTGIFDLKDSGAGITAGELVSTGGTNTIKTATEAEIAAGKAVGKALETASAGEVIEVKLLGY